MRDRVVSVDLQRWGASLFVYEDFFTDFQCREEEGRNAGGVRRLLEQELPCRVDGGAGWRQVVDLVGLRH